MEQIYLDTSVYVKRFSLEAASDVVDRLFSLCEDGVIPIVTSSWTVNEAVAALDRKLRRKEITLKERNQDIATLLTETDRLAKEGKLIVIPVTQENVSSSLRFVIEKHTSADDALHLLSATIGLCSTFVTVDPHLLRAAKEEGFESYNIEDKSEAEELLRRIG